MEYTKLLHEHYTALASTLPPCRQMQLVTVDDVLTMMGDTSSLSEKGELEKLVMAVGRLFSPNDDDYPYLDYPTGWSGDISQVTKKCWCSRVQNPILSVKRVMNFLRIKIKHEVILVNPHRLVRM